MGRRSGYDSSSKAVIWIVVGIVGGLTLFGAGILVLGVMAYRSMGTSAKATFSTVSGKGGSVAKVEGPKQNGIDVGNIALEIAGRDMDGKPLKLSDYHGKVVVLDFWGNWWPYCQALYPDERSLVKRLEGKPFALLGVNTDPDRENLKNIMIDNLITWRSFADGSQGPIARQWKVNSFPTIYLIDHNGVVRRKIQGVPNSPALDKEIDTLVAEAELAKSSS